MPTEAHAGWSQDIDRAGDGTHDRKNKKLNDQNNEKTSEAQTAP